MLAAVGESRIKVPPGCTLFFRAVAYPSIYGMPSAIHISRRSHLTRYSRYSRFALHRSRLASGSDRSYFILTADHARAIEV